MIPMPLKKTTLNFLYENPIGRFFMNEEKYSLWTGCRNPYKRGLVSLAAEDPSLEDDELRADYVLSIPMAKAYKGLLLQGYGVSPVFLKSMESFEVREDDLFIVSYPRSGTTWTEEIVSSIYSEFNMKHLTKKQVHERVVHLEVGRPVGHKAYLKKLKSPRLLCTHMPFDYAPKQLRSLKCKVIYVIRNPKDQAVSYYHFHRTAKYLGGTDRDWSEFLELYRKGQLVYGSWFDHVKDWFAAAQAKPDKVLVISYEELQVDLLGMTKRIAEFTGKEQTDETIQKIVEHCSFSQMKDNPSVNRQEVPLNDLFDERQAKFMRKGVIGDWKNHFVGDQSEQFDRLFDKEMSNCVGLQMAYDKEEAETLMAASLNGRIINLSPSSTPDVCVEVKVKSDDECKDDLEEIAVRQALMTTEL